jgi:two-component system copper resistance phosphate regulon response regulator CusR
MKILLIEDEKKTVQFIKKGLEENGYEVDAAYDGKSGMQLAISNPYNLVITDVIMPGLNGRDLCKELRAARIETPILMLTALGDTDDVVEGLDSGADDYLSKPFEFRELLARIRSLTKRQPKYSNDHLLWIADLVLDLNKKMVIRAGKKIDLTFKEYSLLEYFLRNQGRVISRAELSKNVWNVDFDTGTNMVEVYVNYLRKKIDRDFDKKLIHTQFGMGYILKEE